MMRAMPLRRPITLKIAVWFEERYLRFLIKHADRDIAALKAQIDRDLYRLRAHEDYVAELVRKIQQARMK